MNIKCLVHLRSTYLLDLKSDIIDECKSFVSFMEEVEKENAVDTEETFPFIIDNILDVVLSNMRNHLRIYLTLDVSSVSADRTFSRLKLLKTYNKQKHY